MRRPGTAILAVAVMGAALLASGTAQAITLQLYDDLVGTQIVSGRTTFEWTFDLSAYDILSASYVTIDSAALEVWVQDVDTNSDIPSDVTWGTSRQYFSGSLGDLLIGEADSGSTPLVSPLTTLDLQAGAGTYSYLMDDDFLAEVQVNETDGWHVVGQNNVGHWESYIHHWITHYVWTGWYWYTWQEPVYATRWVTDYTQYFYNPNYDGYLSLLESRLTIEYTIDENHPDYPQVPEPGTMLMLGCVGAGVAAARRARRKGAA